jgi:hypothetical protein
MVLCAWLGDPRMLLPMCVAYVLIVGVLGWGVFGLIVPFNIKNEPIVDYKCYDDGLEIMVVYKEHIIRTYDTREQKILKEHAPILLVHQYNLYGMESGEQYLKIRENKGE